MSIFLLLVGCHEDVVDSAAASSCVDTELATSVGRDDSGTAVTLAVGESFEFTASVGGNENYSYEIGTLDTAIVAEGDTCTDPNEDDGCYDCPTSLHIVSRPTDSARFDPTRDYR